MTRTVGVRLLMAPCCGRAYCAPRYASMNFSAWEYWTDGWREASLMPNDEGLRRCGCGRYLLMRDFEEIASAPESDLPYTARVDYDELPQALAEPMTPEVERAARVMLWHHLNHPYREQYRQHRDVEEAANRAAWEAAQPTPKSWWSKVVGAKPPEYRRTPEMPFTVPPYEPSGLQLQNMQRLAELMADPSYSGANQQVLRAELLRELGRFEEAQAVLQHVPADPMGNTGRLIGELVAERQTAPMRHRGL